ncbi:pyrophosphatase [Paraburkholderia sediminicola]|uniref:pyrophosphatase n=1 Tax=Paraburkholderia sediminicola TaxID=458836 RepID=UPI0038B77C34
MTYDYESAIIEELGDTAWYFFRLVDRLGFSVGDVLSAQFEPEREFTYVATDISANPVSRAPRLSDKGFEVVVQALGDAAAKLLKHDRGKDDDKALLQNFIACYLDMVNETGLSLVSILNRNLEKTEGRFHVPDYSALPVFDEKFGLDERLPDSFAISVIERADKKTYIKWNGVFIGDPLTDNIEGEDGYRFHDVFHMAYAAILHWSPTFRSLIRHKRKSDPKYDEEQDGGRAIVIEEGLSAWIFSIAKKQNYFADLDRLPFDLLKDVQQFISGYEVERCPLSLWEKAILDGYRVFRELAIHKTGVIIGDRISRTIKYERG